MTPPDGSRETRPRFVSPSQFGLWDAFQRSLGQEPNRLDHGVPVDLVVAAHEWSLLTPLLLKEKSDFKAIPQISVDPYIHQVNAAVAFFRRLSPRGLIADDVGLGKTITAGLIVRELLQRKKIDRFLVIAPKLILEQWKDELERKFGLDSEVLVGAAIRNADRHRNVITTYHSAAKHMKDLVAAKFDLVVLDEIHKLRNLHTNAPQMAKAVFQAQHAGAFRYALGLSATPLQNSLWDLYSIADILRTPQPNPYGEKSRFVLTYVADPPVARKLKAPSRDEFKRRTSEYMHRTSRKEAQLRFPDRVVGIESVSPTADEAAVQRQALEILFGNNVPVFARISMAQTLLSSPKAVVAAIEARAGADTGVARLLAPLRDRFAALKTNAKLDRLLHLLRQYAEREPDWRVIVFTIRRATAEFIREALLREGFGDVLAVVMGGQGPQNSAAVADFVATPPRRRVLVSTDSGAEGVNLQACNVLINFDLPWNPMVLEQRIGRIQRLGQKAEKVVVRNLVTRGSVEESVVSRLFEKLQLYDATIGMAEEILGQLQDDNTSIEETILNLVAEALKRRDIEGMLREQEENARLAREELERQRKEMDAVLGSTNGTGGPAMPDIQPAKPTMDLDPFWRAGMTHSGWSLASTDGGKTITAEQAGRRPRRFTFDPDHPGRQETLLGAPNVELVGPDERAFEEVVNAWRKTGLDATRHRSLPEAGELSRQLAGLLDGGQVKAGEATLAARTATGTTRAVLRVNVSVYHDQFEKLIKTGGVVLDRVDLRPGQRVLAALSDELIARAALERAKEAILADPEIDAFEAFYLARKAEETERLQRARRERVLDPDVLTRARNDIEERFTPVVEATLVAWDGELVEAGELRATLTLRDGSSVTSRLLVAGDVPLEETVARKVGGDGTAAVCHAGHIAAASAVTVCSDPSCTRTTCPECDTSRACRTCGSRACAQHALQCAGCAAGICPTHTMRLSDGRGACRDCAATCEVSGAVVLGADLVRCSDTGERVLPEHAVRSAVSNQWIRSTNAVRSDVSGAFALATELETCALTGKRALPSELVTLAGSGDRVVRDLAEQCADTGQWVGKGELETCGVCARRVLPRCLGTCEATGSRVHPAELRKCDETGKAVRPDQLAVSSVSGKNVLRTLLVPCSVTGELALPSEMVRSEVSDRIALPSQAQRCAVTGKMALREELEASSASGRLALPSAMLTCEFSGRRGLPDEFGFCSVSGMRALREYLGASSRSGRVALKKHLGTCAVTGKLLLNSEMVPCAVTGRLADPEHMEKSAVSGALALPSVMAVSSLSGRRVLPSETVTCAETRRMLAQDEVVRCDYTGDVVGIDLTVKSAVSGKTGKIAVMKRSAVAPQSWAAWPSELVVTVTGQAVLPTEAQECGACGALARLASADLGERFECPSCGQVVCIKDKVDAGRCTVCRSAFAAGPSEPRTPIIQEAFPKAKEWRSAAGAKFEVSIGKPSGWALLTKPRLFVTAGGRIVHERELRKGEEVA